MTRRSHAHRQAQRPPALAILILAIGASVAVLPTMAGAGTQQPLEGAGVATLLAKRDADRAALPSRQPPPTSAPVAPPASAPADADTMGGAGGGGSASASPGRPEVIVPSPELRVTIGPGRGATAVFLGDSYTSGLNGVGRGARGWPRLVGSARGWDTVNLAVPGTGFLNPGWTNQRIGSLVSRAASLEPDVVVIAGGHNDSRWSATATAREASKVIDRLKAAIPGALIVVVAPIWHDGSPPRRALDLRDHLKVKADEVDAVFIDSLADGWFGGASHRLIGPDGIHPTNAGHRFIAEQVLAALGS